jgi:hypothetical protein
VRPGVNMQWRTILRRAWRLGLAPAAFYFISLLLLNNLAFIVHFRSTLYAVPGRDTYMMVWNLWWVEKALAAGGWNLWQTPTLFYPLGAPLWAHTFCPLSGLLYWPFAGFLTPTEGFNLNVILAFVLSGWCAFCSAGLKASGIGPRYWGAGSIRSATITSRMPWGT